tara:strand:- start:520 stop:813 length:294 start_codon:yes stop_codon:yes gene_type:complete
MRNVIFILVITSLLLSCQTVERKIDKLSKEEEKNLNRFLGKQQINLIDEFGKPDNVIHESNKKTLVFKTKKYKITCIRKFTVDNNGIISGFNSRNCF